MYFDANPDSKLLAEQVARSNPESLTIYTHKLKEMDYIKYMINKVQVII